MFFFVIFVKKNIMIKIGSAKISNEINELTISQFEKLSRTMADNELDQFEKWAKIFIDLGANEDFVYDLDFEDFKKIVGDFMSTKIEASKEFTKTIEIDGYTYQSFEDEFKLKIRDLKLIEKSISQHPENHVSRTMAILFKRTDLTNIEHESEAHIKLKTKLFQNQKSEIAIPFLAYIGEKLSETAKQIIVEEPI